MGRASPYSTALPARPVRRSRTWCAIVEMAREGVPLNLIQRQLGHVNLAIASVDRRDRHTEASTPSITGGRPRISADAGLRI